MHLSDISNFYIRKKQDLNAELIFLWEMSAITKDLKKEKWTVTIYTVSQTRRVVAICP